ncbi:chalcone and stilbene synthase domain protein [Methylobacterium sp. 4-46]|uniref:type III polyketide synthase n=1 Tax=unclassified Methylobacterium TaxID=2615210 RepID=UPI000152DA90|nr:MULTISPECIES: type III polyketide synthase [Methylobacterium]ACA19945.1 chalcone and stilbene synthase domain protein [Methylobacterium sp. 4-46]WFT79131.1 type III polyketide synthase [Methylobacterium nodulans]
MTSTRARLLSLATAVPPHVLRQTDVAEMASTLFSERYGEFDRLSRVFATTGIHKRHSVQPIDWYMQARGWPERTAAYLRGAEDLFAEAATKALDEAELLARDVDAVVTVSSTGIATPSLEARVLQRLGLRHDVMRVPVFGLGCGGGVSGLAVASRLAESRPGSNVLFVTVELCTLAFRLDKLTKASIVATALFGDGAAACILRAGGDAGVAEVEATGDHTWPDTLDIMGWDVEEAGFGVIFARAIPPFAEANVGPAVLGLLKRWQLGPEQVDRFICHAGGTKVITALERSLAIGQGALDHERAVLSEFGNMSAPTVLFVLDRARKAGLPPRSVLTAMGPGFTASCASLRSPS